MWVPTKKKALIAESDPQQLEHLCMVVKRCGHFDVFAASTSADAVRQAIRLRPDVLIINSHFRSPGPRYPSFDGPQAVQEIARAGARPEIVVMTSLYPYESVLKVARRVGVNHFFPIPYSSRALIKAITPWTVAREQKLLTTLTELLQEIGLPANFKGYAYIREAVIQVKHEPNMLFAVTKELYPAVAERYNTSAECVERSMRHAIGKLWMIGDIDVLDRMFGVAVSPERGKPTNSAFIAVLAEQLTMRGCF